MLAALAAAIVAQGAFYRSGQLLVGLILVGAAFAAWRRPGPGFSLPSGGRQVLLFAATLAGWSIVSAAVADDVRRALSTVALMTGLAVVVACCWRCTEGERESLARATVGLGAAAAVIGWVGVAWHASALAIVDQDLWRAAGTVTYANAAAGLLAPLALVALSRQVVHTTPAGAVTGCLLLTGLGATLSRGGALAFAAGAIALVLLLGFRNVLRASAGPVIGAAVALAGLLPSISSTAPARPGVAAAALAVGTALAMTSTRERFRWAAVVTMAGLVAAACVAVLLGAGPGARLTLASPDRMGEARAALELAGRHPVTGVGPGWRQFAWTEDDGRVRVAEFVHNEYLQVLAEMGAVGFVVLVGLLGRLGTLVRRGAATSAPRWLGIGAAAGLIAMSVHAALDFGWHVPAVGLTGALLVGMCTYPTRKEQV